MKTKKIQTLNNSQPSLKNEPSTFISKQFLPKRKYPKRHLNQINKEKEGCLVSLFVNRPVYEEYKRIDLNKTTTYQRINHHKTKTISLLAVQKQKSISQLSIGDEKGWKTQILKYIELKEKSRQKYEDQYDGYPLMRLSKKNQLLRKMKTNEKFAGKPEIVNKLETQELFEDKPLCRTNPLPKITRQTKHLINKRAKERQYSSSHLGGQLGKSFHFKEVMNKANRSQKMLVNFIGNYFRQKFSPQRRYSHQVPRKQFKDEVIKLQIKNIFQPGHNQLHQKY